MLTTIAVLACRSSAPPPVEEPPASFILQAPISTSATKAPERTPLPPPRRPQDVSLFVLAEAETRAAAEVMLSGAVAVFDAVDAVSVPAGYPRIIEAGEVKVAQPPPDPAQTVPSPTPAAPGKYLVVAGACVEMTVEDDPTGVFAAFFPNSYALPASWPVSGDAHDCPRSGYAEGPSEWETHRASATWAGKLALVTVVHHTATSSETYDFDWITYAVLWDDAGRVLAIESLGSLGLGEPGPDRVVASDPPTIEVKGTSQDQPCLSGGHDIVVTHTAWMVRAVGGAIEVVEGESEKEVVYCPEDPSWPPGSGL